MLNAHPLVQGRSQVCIGCQCTREAQRGPGEGLLLAYVELLYIIFLVYLPGFLQPIELFRSVGTPIKTQSPAGSPWSELRSQIKIQWGPFGDHGAPMATIQRPPPLPRCDVPTRLEKS